MPVDNGMNILDPVMDRIGLCRRPLAFAMAAGIQIDHTVACGNERAHGACPAVPGLPAPMHQQNKWRSIRPTNIADQHQPIRSGKARGAKFERVLIGHESPLQRSTDDRA